MNKEQIQIYHIMLEVNKQSKYQPFSVCLQSLKLIPQCIQQLGLLDNQGDQYILPNINKMVETSNSFMELVKRYKNKSDSNLQVFNRFFCRLRQQVYTLLGTYLSKQKQKNRLLHQDFMDAISYQSIKQILSKINKCILKYQPDINPFPILTEIAMCIRKRAFQLAKQKKISESNLKQLSQKCIQNTMSPEEAKEQTNYLNYRSILKSESSPLRTKKQPEKPSILKMHKLQIICGLDSEYLERQSTSQTQEQLFKQALSRNRCIASLMTRYMTKFKAWEKKPSHKKNRAQSQYRPTHYRSPKIEEKSTTKKKFRGNKYENSRSNTINSIKFSSSLFQTAYQKTQECTVNKQQLINFVFAQREKYCLKKVIIIGNNLQVGPPEPRTQKKIQRKNHSFKIQTTVKTSKNKNPITQKRHSHRVYHRPFNQVSTLMCNSFV